MPHPCCSAPARSNFKQLILWARARAGGKPIAELCRERSWPRFSFDQRLEDIAARVASYLNKRQAGAAASSGLEFTAQA